MNAPTATAATIATSNSNHVVLSKEDHEWVDPLQEAHIGDAIACLSLTLALQNSKDEVRLMFRFSKMCTSVFVNIMV